MKRFLNILFKLTIILTIIILVVVVFAISSNSQKIPEIIVTSSSAEINALKGNYSWNAYSSVMSRDDVTKFDFLYRSDNTILVSPNEKLSISNNKEVGSRHNFEEVGFTCEDAAGSITNVQSTINNIDAYKGYTTIDFNAPQNEGTYVYFVKLGYFEKGEVEYTFKVVVSSEPQYNILEIVKYRDTSLDNIKDIKEIISKLPYSKGIQSYVVRTNNYNSKLVIYYDEILVGRNNFNNNSIALFTLIPELNAVEFNSRSTYYLFFRDELEAIQGRSFNEYVDDPELWEAETLYKDKRVDESNSRYEIIQAIVNDIVYTSSGEKVEAITLDTDSFIRNTDVGFNSVDTSKALSSIREKANVVFDYSLEAYYGSNNRSIYIGAEKIEPVSGDVEVNNTISGDNPEGIKTYEMRIIYINQGVTRRSLYYANYTDNKWQTYLHN